MEKYQDYVIKNGKFVGKFEEMYQKFEDPWHQKENLEQFYSRICTPVSLKEYKLRKVIEVGSGLGAFTNYLNTEVPFCSTIGMDISHTAVQKSRESYPNIDFEVGDLLSLSKAPNKNCDAILLSEVMWYILDDLDEILENLSKNFQDKLIIINQVFYRGGEQKYGNEYFTCLEEMVEYIPWECIKKISIDRIDNGFYESHSVYRV